ncbi:MAG: DGQHR domain-containing protein [Thermoplasmatota archaeon]
MTEAAEWLETKAIVVEQPIGDFYVTVLDGLAVRGIAYADLHQIERENREGAETATDDDDQDLMEYAGIQRPLSPDRVKEIQAFVRTHDATFPTGVLLAVSSKDVEYDGTTLRIRNRPGAASIIDGQHRLVGFAGEYRKPFDLVVVVFVDMTLEMQAHVFATINIKQTRINASLADNLLQFARLQTPEKVVHWIARSLHETEGGPWSGLLKILGTKKDNEDGILSLHAFAMGITKLVYNPKKRNNVRVALQESAGKRKAVLAVPMDAGRHPLWDFYAREEDLVIRQVLLNFFEAMKAEFSNEWGKPASILTKTTGFDAMAIVLRDLLNKGLAEKKLNRAFFDRFASAAKRGVGSVPLTSGEFPPGGIGTRRLAEFFRTAVSNMADVA